MEATAKVTSKGQITLPKSVRDALGIKEGDSVVFRVEQGKATVTRILSVKESAGMLKVPAEQRGKSWTEIRRATRSARATKYR